MTGDGDMGDGDMGGGNGDRNRNTYKPLAPDTTCPGSSRSTCFKKINDQIAGKGFSSQGSVVQTASF